MNKSILTKEISDFLDEVLAYKELLLRSSGGVIPEIESNHDEIVRKRSALVRKHARFERCLDRLGKNPRMRDGVNPEYYNVYDNAFSADILQRVGPSLRGVEQDLNYIVGKLESMTEKDFDSFMEKNRETNDSKVVVVGGGGGAGGSGSGGGRGGDGGSATIGIPPKGGGIEHVENLHQRYWGMLLKKLIRLIKKFIAQIIIGVIVIVVGTVVIAKFGLE